MECQYCHNRFKTNSSLLCHQRRAKYCLEIQGKSENPEFTCTYCENVFTSKRNLQHHEEVCEYRVSYLTQENMRLKQENIQHQKMIEELKSQVKDLQNILADVAKKPTNITNNTNNNQQNINQIINNLLPISDDHLRDQAQYLTLEHVKQGASGYAQYAVQYPLKNRITCVDFARRKIKYKNEDGTIISDPDMAKLTQKLFSAIQEKNSVLIQEYSMELMKKMLDTSGNDEMTEEETKQLHLETNAVVEQMTKMATQNREVGEIARGFKPEIHADFTRQVCSWTT